MSKSRLAFVAVLAAILTAPGYAESNSDFKLALVDHHGQLRWSAKGFKVIQSSAKPNGQEIGIRGKDDSGRLTFLGFLFLFPELTPLTSAKCRDGVLNPEKKSNATLKVLGTSEITQSGSAFLFHWSTTPRRGAMVSRYTCCAASSRLAISVVIWSFTATRQSALETPT